ncbi:protein phosphatase 2C domain-containing protein [Salana multivorans]
MNDDDAQVPAVELDPPTAEVVSPAIEVEAPAIEVEAPAAPATEGRLAEASVELEAPPSGEPEVADPAVVAESLVETEVSTLGVVAETGEPEVTGPETADVEVSEHEPAEGDEAGGPASAAETETESPEPLVSEVPLAEMPSVAAGPESAVEEPAAAEPATEAAAPLTPPAEEPTAETPPPLTPPAEDPTSEDPAAATPAPLTPPGDDFGTPEPFGTPPVHGLAAAGPMRVAHVPAQPYAVHTAPMAPAIRICTYCQGTIAQDGYCLECGEREVSARDRFGERPARWLAGVSDLGLVHRRNEDALSLAVAMGGGAAVTGTGVLVVCDGVTTAPDSDVASLAAAQAASGTMVRAITAGDPRAPRQGLLSAAIRAGHAAAAQAVIDTTSPDLPEEDAPSCTFVACAVEPGTIVTGWVGDSRAYWFPDGGTPVKLSSDHSWAAELVAEGMSEEEAMATPNAHAITRWVGRDAPGDGPELAALHPTVGGLVLVCSDGLWNYCPEPQALAELVEEKRASAGAGLEALAVSLVDWARAQGGRDNISVALARVDSLEPAASAAPAASSSSASTRSAEPAAGGETDQRSTSNSSTTERGTDGDVQR